MKPSTIMYIGPAGQNLFYLEIWQCHEDDPSRLLI
jgi:hypothetical protein